MYSLVVVFNIFVRDLTDLTLREKYFWNLKITRLMSMNARKIMGHWRVLKTNLESEKIAKKIKIASVAVRKRMLFNGVLLRDLS